MMNQLCSARQSYTDLSKTDQEFLKANHQQFSLNCMPSLEEVQPLTIANHKEGNMIAIIDVSTAFLQSNKFPEGKVKYVKFKNPITGETMYFKQFGPLYGEKSAPREWEDTIAPFIESLGLLVPNVMRAYSFTKTQV